MIHQKPNPAFVVSVHLPQHRLRIILGVLILVSPLFSFTQKGVSGLKSPPAPVKPKENSQGPVEVNLAPELSTPYPDLVTQHTPTGLYLITKGHKNHFGKAAGPDLEKADFRLYKVEPNAPPKPKHVRVASRFGASTLEVGFGKNQRTGQSLYAVSSGLSASTQAGSKRFTTIPEIGAKGGEIESENEIITNRINVNPIFSSFHPAIHPNGQLIVFSTNRPTDKDPYSTDSIGGIDLYYILKANGYWGQAKAFDTCINSRGDELFATFSASGDLFFASNGRGGQGKFDLFQAKIILIEKDAQVQRMEWQKATALPMGFNSKEDDLMIAWSTDEEGKPQQAGYISSNRLNGKDPDIFYFKVKYPEYKGQVLSANGQPIPGAKVSLLTQNMDTLKAVSGADGRFTIKGRFNQTFRLMVQADGYHPISPKDPIDFRKMQQGSFLVRDTVQLTPVNANTATIILELADIHDMRRWDQPEKVGISTPKDGEREVQVEASEGMVKAVVPTDQLLVMDLAMSDGSKAACRFFVENHYQGDSITARIRLSSRIDSIRNLFIQLPPGTERTEPPIGNLVWYDEADEHPILVTHERGDLAGNLRMALPQDYSAPCSLVVVVEGFIPEVFDLKAGVVPDTIQLIAIKDLELQPIRILHPYNQARHDTTLLSRLNLERIAQVMLFDHTLILRVVSHTDIRGSNEYNQQLSQKRATSIKEYIISRTKIPDDRIEAIGKGEREVLVPCPPGSACEESVHKQNRRTEIWTKPPVSYSISEPLPHD